LQNGALEREPQNAKDADSLGIWKKHVMNMFMILMHHHRPLQSHQERQAKKGVTIVPSVAAETPEEQLSIADPL